MSELSDKLDAASNTTMEETDRRVAEARRAAARDAAEAAKPLPDACLNCGEVPRERSRFCNSDCRTDHDRRKELERRAGKR